jgi:hypothetical protein
MTVDPAAGVWVKLERAREHIQYLSDQVNSFYDRHPYRLVGEEDPRSGLYIVSIHINETPDLRWGVVAGDAVHNMRSALDNLWHRLWYKPGSAAYRRARYDGFPWFDNVQQLEARFKTRPKNAREKAIVDVLRSLRPYKSGNSDLSALIELSNEDKHTSFLPVLGALRGDYRVYLTFRGVRQGPIVVPFAGMCPIQDAAEIARLRATAQGICRDEPVGVNCEVDFAVTLGQPRVVQGMPIVPLLARLGSLVDEIAALYRPFFST